jgi:hypothetical protein
MIVTVSGHADKPPGVGKVQQVEGGDLLLEIR